MNQLVLIFISFFVFLTDASIMAQADSVKVRYGEVIILADSAIVKLERTTRKFKEVKGYRVQIFLGSLEETKGERNKYLSQGLPYSAYIKQIVPEHALQIARVASGAVYICHYPNPLSNAFLPSTGKYTTEASYHS